MGTFNILSFEKKNIIVYFLIFLSLFLLSLQIWLERFFGVVDFEQFIIFLSFGLNGLLDSDDYIINKFIQICIFFPIIGTIFINLISRLTFFFDNIYFLNIIFNLTKKFIIYISLFFFIISFSFFLKNISFEEFILKSNDIDFIEENYVEPELKDFSNIPTSKNLVFIYVESLENLLLNNNLINQEAIDKFNLKKFNAQKFKKFKPTKYTNWTIGSIVATQCGVPQKPAGILDTETNKLNRNKESKFGYGMNVFLPNVYCLGDLLKASNYENIFINSVDLSFAATGLFFQEHGYDEIIGKKYFEKSDYKYNSYTWGGGPNDSVLFDLAKNKILKLKKAKRKFNITILTTDTHAPGFVDDKCNYNGNINDNNLSKALICTSENLYNFVDFLVDEFSEEIVIIIMGDHVYPGKISNNDKSTNIERIIYNRIISKDFLPNRNLINHYDLFPTILNLLGFTFKNNRLGLGFSTLQGTNISNYDIYFKNLEDNIQNKSDRYVKFWK